jgi:hypothetical protein
MRFKLTIELGNSAMCNNAHVAAALKQVATHLCHFNRLNVSLNKEFEYPVMDLNGNKVGSYCLVKE